MSEGAEVVIGGVSMPKDFCWRVIQALNLEINEMKKEVEGL